MYTGESQKGVDRNRGGSDKRADRMDLESDLDGVEGKEMRPMSQHRYSNRSRELGDAPCVILKFVPLSFVCVCAGKRMVSHEWPLPSGPNQPSPTINSIVLSKNEKGKPVLIICVSSSIYLFFLGRDSSAGKNLILIRGRV